MKRVRRIFLSALTAISLLLAIAMAGLWVRSAFYDDRYFRITANASGSAEAWYFNQYTGTLTIAHNSYRGPDPIIAAVVLPQAGMISTPLHGDVWSNLLPTGWGFKRGKFAGVTAGVMTGSSSTIGFPHWFAILILTALPLARAVSMMRCRRPPGLCPACGYDTRANPAKCSECGYEIAQQT